MNVQADRFSAFAAEILNGLRGSPKWTSSKWFYDKRGSEIFEQIMALPEYYLTRAEDRLLRAKSADLALALSDSSHGLQIIELGCGDGRKTMHLLREVQEFCADWLYVPVDVSSQALQQVNQRFGSSFPLSRLSAVHGDNFDPWPAAPRGWRRAVVFLGSSLGNFDDGEAGVFLRTVRRRLQPGDRVLLGLDLRKDPRKILRAYDDSAGVTADFNLNLLSRLNNELATNFELDSFQHYATYSPLDGVARSFLVSRRQQIVESSVLGASFRFQMGEAIFTERSKKYQMSEVHELLTKHGFTNHAVWTDAEDQYVLVMGIANGSST